MSRATIDSMTDAAAPSTFFAYPGGSPLLAETMRSAAKRLVEQTGLHATTWEDLQVDGLTIIGQILKAIDDATVVVAEVTDLNSNVLFEVGYALARGKQLILALDTSDSAANDNWKSLGLLSSIGYTAYEGSSETLVGAFTRARPDLRKDGELWEDLLVQGNAGPRLSRSLFYVPIGSRTDADRNVDRSLKARKDLSLRVADDEEQGLAPLPWYAVQIYQSSAALIHLRGPQRTRATIHNARGSFFAGVAVALELPTLLVAEDSFAPPLDYRDLLSTYSSARRAKAIVESWLDGLPATGLPGASGRRQLAVELPIRQFGEYVAENEAQYLPNYFVDTGQFRSVLEAHSAVFVGRKGTGKTANMLTAADTLAADKRSLVVVVKPSGYELESLMSILERLPTKDVATYLIDAIWRYMLMTEIARAAVADAVNRPAGISTGSPMDELRIFMDRYPGGVEADFAIRLEHLIAQALTGLEDIPAGVEESQGWINERLHDSSLVELRRVLGQALQDRQRVAVLIDNLDKAWERNADRERQSRVILGLLTAVGQLEREFRRDHAWRESVNVTLSVFLRADIFDEVKRFAREPDKIRALEVEWTDSVLLARVIEDRYVSQRPGADASELWSTFFTPTVLGRPTRDFLLWRSLPRPRDLVYLCNACVLNAINRRHDRIEEEDIRSAEEDYSRFAFDALRVEGSVTDELDAVLLGFAGWESILDEDDVGLIVQDASTLEVAPTIERLLKANFLGIEVSPGLFDYPRSDQYQVVAVNRAKRYSAGTQKAIRYEVHPAFRPYLGVIDT